MRAKPAITFLSRDSDANLFVHVNAILSAMNGNPSYPDPTPTLPVIVTSLEAFRHDCSVAADGGKSLTSAKNDKRAALVALVRNLAGYVHVNCQGSLPILLSSGFPIQKPERQSVGSIPSPKNPVLSLGTHSGELDAQVPPVRGAIVYNWKLMAADAPTVVLQTAQSSGASKTFACLTPGKVYVAEVNAFATAGPTDWVKSGPQMVV